MTGFIQTHGFDAMLAYFVFSAGISGMPEPSSSSSVGYSWLYHSLHILSGDLSSLFGSRIQKA